jgi:hypothetical protein
MRYSHSLALLLAILPAFTAASPWYRRNNPPAGTTVLENDSTGDGATTAIQSYTDGNSQQDG